MPRRPSKLKNTRIFEQGRIRASNQIISNPVFGEFLINRVTEVQEMMKEMSERQQDKINEAIKSNPERSVDSRSFQVFLAEEYWKSKQKAG